MANVGNIMTTEVVTLDPEMSLREAVETLGSRRVTGAPVLAGSRLVGVVSATDLMEFQGSNPAITSPEDELPSLRQGLHQEEEDFEGDPGAFFVDFWGDAGSDVYQRLAGNESPEWDLLAKHTVGEVMTRKIVSLSPDAGLQEVARLMSDQGIHRVLVTKGDALVGIVSTMDLVRAVADGILVAKGTGGAAGGVD